MPDHDPLAIVVPTRNRPAMLEPCLRSIATELGAADELVVVDSASDDPRAVTSVARRCGARLVRLERPGASAARNAGWRATTASLVAFVDDDVRVRPGWAAGIRAGFRDGADFVTGRVVVPDHQAAAERPVAVSSRTEPTDLHPGLLGDLGASANLAVRRKALERIGGFDERLGPGRWAASAEDLDLFDRLFAAGFRGKFEPLALAEHEQWRSRGQLIRLDWRYGKGMGVRLARLARHDPARARRLLREAVVDQGVRPVMHDVRHGYEFGAATVVTRTLGTVWGRLLGVMLRSRVGNLS